MYVCVCIYIYIYTYIHMHKYYCMYYRLASRGGGDGANLRHAELCHLGNNHITSLINVT